MRLLFGMDKYIKQLEIVIKIERLGISILIFLALGDACSNNNLNEQINLKKF